MHKEIERDSIKCIEKDQKRLKVSVMTINSKKIPGGDECSEKREPAPCGSGTDQNRQNTALTAPCGLSVTQADRQQIKLSPTA